MGWANRITVLRGLLTGVVLVLLLVGAPDPSSSLCWTAFVFFVVTAVSDTLDGAVARRMKDVSVFGRIADPLVDKLLVLGTMIVLLPIEGVPRVLPAWAVVLMLAREYLVTALRGAVEGRGVSFQAVALGKVKMLLQCVAVGAVILYVAGAGAAHAEVPLLASLTGRDGTFNVAHVLVWLATIVTVISGVDYGRRAVRLLKQA